MFLLHFGRFTHGVGKRTERDKWRTLDIPLLPSPSIAFLSVLFLPLPPPFFAYVYVKQLVFKIDPPR